jgi:hypothetical protein
MSEQKYLVIFEADWADEFDMHGFEVMNDEDLKAFNYGIDNADYPVESGFGTNESFIWESSDEVRQAFTITEIDENEVAVLEKLFDGDFGFVPGCCSWAK